MHSLKDKFAKHYVLDVIISPLISKMKKKMYTKSDMPVTAKPLETKAMNQVLMCPIHKYRALQIELCSLL